MRFIKTYKFTHTHTHTHTHIHAHIRENTYTTLCRYVPKCFKVPRKGGTDGDGLDPEFNFEANGADFGPWMQESSPADHVDDLVDKVSCVCVCVCVLHEISNTFEFIRFGDVRVFFIEKK